MVRQVLLVGVAYVWAIVPVVYRLATCWWSNSAAPLHILQVVLPCIDPNEKFSLELNSSNVVAPTVHVVSPVVVSRLC